MPKSQKSFWIVAFLIAGGIDFLFWKKTIGISFLVWSLLAMGGALYLLFREGYRPARESIWLGLMITGLASIPFFRTEPFTRAMGVLVGLFALMVWATTLRNGYWIAYTLWDVIRALAVFLFSAVTRPFTLLISRNQPSENNRQNSTTWQGWAVIRGILLALPVVGVLALLLASADLIFAERLQSVWNVLRLENLPELLFRIFYVAIFTFVFCGVLLHAVLPSSDTKPTSNGKNIIPPFLGWTESSILLGSVNLLFLFFVVLQFRYLFGGQVNIHETGYTYAEYARRGFGELVWVACITLMLILILNTISRRETSAHQRGFVFLSSLLIGLVLVILASAWQRLTLYEQAYGFTRLRTYTFIFIPWLGLLMLTVLGLLVTRQMRRVAQVIFLFAIGFGWLLGIWNIDGWIVRQNVQRTLEGYELDGDYLQSLSSDAVPELIKQSQRTDLPEDTRQELLLGLACRASQSQWLMPAWQSFNLSEDRAQKILSANTSLWQTFPVQKDENGTYVLLNGNPRYCRSSNSWDE